jgi:predicted phage terminase large subunit-like protein
MAADLLRLTVLGNPWIPHSPTVKQAYALSLPHLEVLFGGAAGGGKSDWLLASAAQYVNTAGYAALLLRKTYADLALPNALMERAQGWWSGRGAHWNGETHTWTFPSGATVTFGYLEHEADIYRYQGAELQMIGFDELTQFSEQQYLYLFSRLRRLKATNVPLRMRAASNPGGVGHEWVKARFVTAQDAQRAFIPARVLDNPYIDQAEYIRSLGLLDSITRAQLLDGNWDVRREGALARREWFPVVDAAPVDAQRARFWDMAATERSAKSSDPDWTVGTRVANKGGTYYVEHVVRERVGAAQVEGLIRQTAQADGQAVTVCWEQEGGSSGKIVTSHMEKLLGGFPFRAVPVHKDKVTRAMPMLSQAEAGNVKLVRGPWIAAWLDEMCAFPQAAHDDQVDSASGAFAALTTTHYKQPGAVSYV